MADAPKYYLTKEGLEKIKKEYKKLSKLRKLKSKEAVPPVLHSEELNTEFVAHREDLDFLDSRIAELENILRNSELIKPPPRKERDRIHLGAQVKVEVDDQIDEFTIVGTLEANPSLGKISNESPVGKALLGHRAGEEVTVHSAIETTYRIKKIKYPSLG